MILYDNLDKLRAEIAACGREVTLVAASKTQTLQTIDEFMNAVPNCILGENRVQELLDKYDPKYVWHFIGRLQTNKVKYIVDKVELIHSLDRLELACEIEKQAAKHGKIQHCLIEVNMGGEVSKGGISPDDVNDFIISLKDFDHIDIRGIMSVMPKTEDITALHSLYDGLYSVFRTTKDIVQKNVHIEYLSAGMSGDYRIALEHGSNMLRLGSFLFGERQVKKSDTVV